MQKDAFLDSETPRCQEQAVYKEEHVEELAVETPAQGVLHLGPSLD